MNTTLPSSTHLPSPVMPSAVTTPDAGAPELTRLERGWPALAAGLALRLGFVGAGLAVVGVASLWQGPYSAATGALLLGVGTALVGACTLHLHRYLGAVAAATGGPLTRPTGPVALARGLAVRTVELFGG